MRPGYAGALLRMRRFVLMTSTRSPHPEEPAQRASRELLQRRCQQAGYGEGVEQHQLIANLEGAADGHKPVAVEPGREQPGLALLIGLEHRERCFDTNLAR